MGGEEDRARDGPGVLVAEDGRQVSADAVHVGADLPARLDGVGSGEPSHPVVRRDHAPHGLGVDEFGEQQQLHCGLPAVGKLEGAGDRPVRHP